MWLFFTNYFCYFCHYQYYFLILQYSYNVSLGVHASQFGNNCCKRWHWTLSQQSSVWICLLQNCRVFSFNVESRHFFWVGFLWLQGNIIEFCRGGVPPRPPPQFNTVLFNRTQVVSIFMDNCWIRVFNKVQKNWQIHNWKKVNKIKFRHITFTKLY